MVRSLDNGSTLGTFLGHGEHTPPAKNMSTRLYAYVGFLLHANGALVLSEVLVVRAPL